MRSGDEPGCTQEPAGLARAAFRDEIGEVEPIATADDVDAAARRLFGAALGAACGVLHVTSVAREDPLQVIRVGPDAPKSATDFFVLQLARARVEAILVTGSVLRAEPTLRYELAAPFTEALRAWRRRAGLAAPPLVAVLTRDAALPADHPTWTSWARPVVLTDAPTAAALRARLPARVQIVAHPAPSPRAALAHLRGARGCRGISVEAGPRVAAPLYAPPVAVDELLLGVFEGPLPETARAGALVDEPTLEGAMRRVGGPTAVREPSGVWRFSRWLSPARRGTAAGSR
ncbi:MAG TPA: hypothetical protein RMH99_31185 [Sandaracinaceae bacterium LLY-WYZ-13_1]|nr:hypothetical protein [Sandaracinaceae bacterium LLY-WYZ-13_1]